MSVAAVTADLRAEARRADERRLLVCHGPREACYRAAREALGAAGSGHAAGADGANADDASTDGTPGAPAVTVVSDRDVGLAAGSDHGAAVRRLPLARADALLGTTRDAVVLDCHDACRPNAVGRAVGAVDGGGLLVVLAPHLDAWPDRRDGFDEGLAVPPDGVEDVAGNFRRRLVRTLRAHPGVAIVDAATGRVERDGLTRPAPRRPTPPPSVPPEGERSFPAAAYEACLTADQSAAVAALEALSEPGRAVVVEADRGRGKSSAAGLAAGALVAAGRDVLVTAPGYVNAAEAFERACELLAALEVDHEWDAETRRLTVTATERSTADGDRPREAQRGNGQLRFARPAAAAAALAGDGGTDGSGPGGARRGDEAACRVSDAPDAVVVDEAAAVPVRLLTRFLPDECEDPAAATPVAFATTVHGYEGAGRGFAVRFRDRLADSGLGVETVDLAEPVRYAPGDPVEVWAFRALMLDARPAVAPLVEAAAPERTEYVALDPARLAAPAGEHRLREAFGLLVAAHYRTEPNDLARLLDAPNVRIRALLADGHVVSVALLAREGGLSPERRRRIYEGERVKGNMLPDVLTSQLRDEAAAAPTGLRVLRIATHHAARSRGLGSRLLADVRREFAPAGDAGGGAGDAAAAVAEGAGAGGRDASGGNDVAEGSGAAGTVDWLGVGFGATPALLSFWAANGYRTVHLSTTRNEASGEYSALMLAPLTAAGRALHDRSAAWFCRRVASVLADPLADADPDVVRATLGAVDPDAFPDRPGLADREWRLVAAAAFGPGMFDVSPRPFRRLALGHLIRGDADLGARAERLLVRKVLQAQPWDAVVREADYVSRSECMRALGAAYRPLVEVYGTAAATAEAQRYR